MQQLEKDGKKNKFKHEIQVLVMYEEQNAGNFTAMMTTWVLDLQHQVKGLAVIQACLCELAWPGGKALSWRAEGRRFDSPLRLPFLFKNNYCDLWTLSTSFSSSSASRGHSLPSESFKEKKLRWEHAPFSTKFQFQFQSRTHTAGFPRSLKVCKNL